MTQNVAGLVRDLEARKQALRTYAAAHDKFADREQELAGASVEAAGAHWYAYITLRAYRAECDNQEPSGIGTLTPYRYNAADRG